MTDLSTLNSLRSYLSQLQPINPDAVFQRLTMYRGPELPMSPTPQRTVVKQPVQTAYGIPLVQTKIAPSPPRIPPSSIGSCQPATIPFDIQRVREGRGSYTVEELKGIADSLGLPSRGRKSELVDRILAKCGMEQS